MPQAICTRLHPCISSANPEYAIVHGFHVVDVQVSLYGARAQREAHLLVINRFVASAGALGAYSYARRGGRSAEH